MEADGTLKEMPSSAGELVPGNFLTRFSTLITGDNRLPVSAWLNKLDNDNYENNNILQ